ncbi:DNA adenine methylase [Brevibacillus porteri]|uniref:DNA adenine methylase n=1 Tax=Brevibacillus porteri TaxID=2126350 RepID=UPI003639574D
MKAPRILHYPGSKWSMADWIIEHMPEHETYLEPFFGSGAVLFNKAPSQVETVNDLDSQVVNLFRVIRDRGDELAEKLYWTPAAREEYYNSYEPSGDELEDARRFLVRCWQAIGVKTSDRTGWRSIISPNGSYLPKQFGVLPERVLRVAERLKGVEIENQAAGQLLERYKRPKVLIYADPPYVLETRTNRHYKHEMNVEEHLALLDMLDDHPGPVLLSGYSHPLYDDRLKHWRREIFMARAEQGVSRTEVLWINPVAAEQVGQQTIFSMQGI